MDPLTSLIAEAIKVLGPMGFILWLVHRNTTHTIPRLAKDYMDSQDKARQDFKEILVDQRETFIREMQREREVHGQSVDSIVDSIKELKE